MRCRRAFEADLPAVLQGDGDAEFRAHYPGCADCAGEVLVWRELEAMLRTGGPAAGMHPEPEEILAFVDAPATLAPSTRATVTGHLAACRVCADEVATLRRADLGAPASRAAAPHASRSRLTRLVWHPGFAYALVAVLLVPLLRDQVARFGARAPVAEHVAERERDAPEQQREEAMGGAPLMAERREAVASARLRQAEPAAAAAAPSEKLAKTEKRAESSAAEDLAEGAPSLRDLAGATALAERAPAASADAPPVVALAAGRPATIGPAEAERGPLLRLATPDTDGAMRDLRVRSEAGREIVERVPVRANAIAMRIPPRWLTPGDYVVTLTPPGTVFALTVRAPRGPAAAR